MQHFRFDTDTDIFIYPHFKTLIINRVFDNCGLARYHFPHHLLKHYHKMTNYASYGNNWMFLTLRLQQFEYFAYFHHPYNRTYQSCVLSRTCQYWNPVQIHADTDIANISTKTNISRYQYSPNGNIAIT